MLARGATTRSRTPVAVEHAAARRRPARLRAAGPGRAAAAQRLVPASRAASSSASSARRAPASRRWRALVVGLWAPTAGGIYLDGQSTFAHERGSFGEAVGYLPQDPLLFDGKVRENIARFRDADMADVVAAARLAGVHELIGRLPQRLRDPARRRRRAALRRPAAADRAGARASSASPKLIVLDEPNSNLDAEGEAALIEAIEIARARGAAVLVVAQRMSILNRADQLLVLKDGAVAQFGDRAEVLATLGAAPAGRVGGRPRRCRCGGRA